MTFPNRNLPAVTGAFPRLDWRAPINLGMSGCWLMNETGGQVFKDILGANDGAGVGSPSRAPSMFGPVSAFNGSSQKIQLPSMPHSYHSGTGWSFCAWVNTSILNGAYHAIWRDDSADMGFYLNSVNKLCFRSGGSENQWATTPTIGTWYFVCGVNDANDTTSSFYVNGVSVGGGGNGIVSNTSSSAIGGDGFSQYWNGSIFGVRAWNRALSAQEVMLLFAQPFAGLMSPRAVNFNNATGVQPWVPFNPQLQLAPIMAQ